jgi:hypothetical protein
LNNEIKTIAVHFSKLIQECSSEHLTYGKISQLKLEQLEKKSYHPKIKKILVPTPILPQKPLRRSQRQKQEKQPWNTHQLYQFFVRM